MQSETSSQRKSLGNRNRGQYKKKTNEDMNSLTVKEKEIIELVMKGGNTRTISHLKHRSTSVVSKYFNSIRRKLDACNMAHAVALYLRESSPAKLKQDYTIKETCLLSVISKYVFNNQNIGQTIF